jgi:cyclophilin family peptidyl-prolyl cis-trans isomerase
MKRLFRQVLGILLCCLTAPLALAQFDAGDFGPQNPVASIQLNGRQVMVEMEDLRNPLVLVQTTRGDFVVELYPQETPRLVAGFLDLAGEGYYDGLPLHRVVRDFLVQGGSPDGSAEGGPGFVLPDEMSATSLGLDTMPLIDVEGRPHPWLGVRNDDDFRSKVLEPLYLSMGILSEDSLARRLSEVDTRLRSMSLQDFYEMQGWRYTRARTRPPLRGSLVMANRGPGTNGSQFFVPLADLEWLSGKASVIGQVRGGMDVVDTIGRLPVDATQRPLEGVTVLLIRQVQL